MKITTTQKLYKITWQHGGWAIVYNWIKFNSRGVGTFICGSRRGTKNQGDRFTFRDFEKVEEITSEDLENLIKDNFVELL